MNNPNPFVPKGSLLAQQSQRRSRLKIMVGCVLGVSVASLVVMLIQGCKREQPQSDTTPPPDTNVAASTPSGPDLSSNPPPAAPGTNPVATAAPVAVPVAPPVAPITPPAPPTPPPDVTAAVSTYEVVAGDTLAKIAKKNGVSLKALEAANPGVDPKKLKVKQKLNIPGGSAAGTPSASSASPASGSDVGGETYTIKSGDTLSKIAKRHGISLKALRAANPKLNTDHIKVGDKLTLPAKAESAAPAPAPAPDNSGAPSLPPPASTPAPVAPVAPTPSGPGR